MKQLIFKQPQSPGDLLMLSVAIRDLHLTYPYQYETDVICFYPELFFNNQFITKLPKDKNIEIIDLFYNDYAEKLRDRYYHFSDCFIHILNEKLNICIKKTTSKASIDLTENEKNKNYVLDKYNLKKNYILLNAGIKPDIPLKQYPVSYYQKIVNELNNDKSFDYDIVQVGHNQHLHPILNGVIDLVGKTNYLRDYFSLVYNSSGCINHVSLQMHLANTFNKKCIVLAGNRECEWWNHYKNQIYIESDFNCNGYDKKGCWKKKRNECEYMGNYYSKCMEMIKPDYVLDKIYSILL